MCGLQELEVFKKDLKTIYLKKPIEVFNWYTFILMDL